MKTCPCCGHTDNPFWRSSKFELNADYMSEVDFEKEYPDIAMFLPAKPYTLLFSGCIYYRRGKKAKQVYRVPVEDFKVETEKAQQLTCKKSGSP
jgi:hypothetical protein